MGQSFRFAFKILRNTKGFLISMVIMPILMIVIFSLTMAYSEVPTVGYIGKKAPNLSRIKTVKLSESEKDYFLGIAQGTLVVKTDEDGMPEKYYSSIPDNPLIVRIENSRKSETEWKDRPQMRYSVGVILFKLLTSASLLATVLIREKENGVLLRVRNSEVPLRSYILGRSLAVIFVYEIAILLILAFYRLAGFDLGGISVFQLGFLFSATLFISTGLYILLSSLLRNEGHLWVVSTGVLFPLAVFSGILFPVESMAEWMKTIAHASPLYYLQKAIVDGRIDGMPLLIMLAAALFFGVLGVKRLNRNE